MSNDEYVYDEDELYFDIECREDCYIAMELLADASASLPEDSPEQKRLDEWEGEIMYYSDQYGI